MAIVNDLDAITPNLIEYVAKEHFKLVQAKIKDVKSPHKEKIVKQKDILTEDPDELVKLNIERNISKKSKDDLDCSDSRKITDTDDPNYNALESSGYIKSNI